MARARERDGGALPRALDAEALGFSGGHRRGRLFPRLGFRLEIDRQHSSMWTPATKRPSRDDRCGSYRARERRLRESELRARLRRISASSWRGAASPSARSRPRSRRTASRSRPGASAQGGTRFARFPGEWRAAGRVRQARRLRRHPSADARHADASRCIFPGTRRRSGPC